MEDKRLTIKYNLMGLLLNIRLAEVVNLFSILFVVMVLQQSRIMCYNHANN